MSARWRGDAGSSSLDGASTAASPPGNEFVKSTWDAAPRTEHAVLAAGEALEVAAAAHCRRAVLFVVRAACCAILARELHALLTASQAGCSECSVWAIAADALFCSSSSCEALINTHAYLAIGQLVGACEAAKKRATETWHMTATPHAYAKQQHSTIPEGRYPSQPVAAQTERYCALASEEL